MEAHGNSMAIQDKHRGYITKLIYKETGMEILLESRVLQVIIIDFQNILSLEAFLALRCELLYFNQTTTVHGHRG